MTRIKTVISVLIVFLAFSSQEIFAQLQFSVVKKKNYTIFYQKPIRGILLLAPRNILRTFYAEEGYPVYKILVMSTKNKDLAKNTKLELEKAFPKQQLNLIYREPSYKIVYGFFKFRIDAEIEIKKLNRYFLNQRPLVIFAEKEPIEKVNTIFSKTKNLIY